jgi:hypothetical protein
VQAQTQPFFRLVQSNMELLGQFSTSPEVTKEFSAIAGNLLEQVTESAAKLMQSGALASLMQGMLKNYTDFLMELSQTNMALLSQGQSALVRQVEQVADTVVEATEVQGRRLRHAA